MSADNAYAVELKGLSFKRGARSIFNNVDIRIPRGKVTGIMGPSGCGKTTLLRLMGAQLRPSKGEVWVNGQNLPKLSRSDLFDARKHMGVLFQSGALFTDLDVFENVAFPLRERNELARPELAARVTDILERLNIADIAQRMPGEISAGQRKRVGLARAIVLKPEIMIYDEPTTGQDPLRTRDIDDMIQQTQQQFDITSIVISHDMASTFRIAHLIAMLYKGKIVAFGSPAELRASTNEHVQQFIHAGSVDVKGH